jgi:hypothetical protein
MMEDRDLQYFCNRPFVRVALAISEFVPNQALPAQISMFAFFGSARLMMVFPIVRELYFIHVQS